MRTAVAHLDRVLDSDLAGLRVTPSPGGDADLPIPAANTFPAERDRLLDDVVRPALQAYRDLLAGEVLAAGRDDTHVGLAHLPDGEATYATLTRQHTSTDRTPDDLHAMGLRLIEDLAGEYADVGQRVFGTADVDDELAFTSEDDMLDAARAAIERAEAVAPQRFGTVPSQGCQVEAVPVAAAPGAPGAYYLPPAMDGSQPGTYFLNTYEPTKRRRHLAEAVAFHEAVPGHHFQLTVAQERTDLPVVRRVMIDTAFAAGWGLYCERLAEEMGLYSDDVARLGMLAADSWRAARLVVDTGIHARGWSRQQAIGAMAGMTPLSLLEVTTEVDRYIAYPGQALSYMVGRHELLGLRARTTERLGEAFDLRAFHDLLLGTEVCRSPSWPAPSTAGSLPPDGRGTGRRAQRRARSVRGRCGVLRGHLAPDVVHVELLDTGDDLLQRGSRQRAGLREHQDAVTEGHQRRDGRDARHRGERLLRLGVDLGEGDGRVRLRGLLVDGGELLARAAPLRPEVDEHDAVALHGSGEGVGGQVGGSHGRCKASVGARVPGARVPGAVFSDPVRPAARARRSGTRAARPGRWPRHAWSPLA